jgi:hypothetical protein
MRHHSPLLLLLALAAATCASPVNVGGVAPGVDESDDESGLDDAAFADGTPDEDAAIDEADIVPDTTADIATDTTADIATDTGKPIGPGNCLPGQKFCMKGNVMQCSEYGYAQFQPCNPPKTTCIDAACRSVICLPGEPACDGDVPKKCNASGDGFIDLSKAPCGDGGQTCFEGKCETAVCTMGQPDCYGSQVAVCVQGGMSLEPGEDCGKNALVCHAGACAKCQPGSLHCATGVVQTCKADGSGWGSDKACPASTVGCAAGACLPADGMPSGRLAVGSAFTCAVRNAGTVSCWGDGIHAAAGDGGAWEVPVPTPVVGLDEVVSVAAGSRHACALRKDASVWCWGLNFWGQLGNGQNAADYAGPDWFEPKAVAVQGLPPVRSVAAGNVTTCAVTMTGTLWCWGYVACGQGGDGTPLTECDVTPEQMPSAKGMALVPKQVPGLTDVQEVAVGHAHVCALSATGIVKCWGHNGQGQIGNGKVGQDYASYAAAGEPKPVTLQGLPPAAALFAGDEGMCVRTLADDVWCWANTDGLMLYNFDVFQLPTQPKYTPMPQSYWRMSYRFASYETPAACGVQVGGNVLCVGSASSGKIGDVSGNSNGWVEVATPMPLPGPAREVGLGYAHGCARLATGAVWCWGTNKWGQLGTGDFKDSAVPVATQFVP